MNARTDKKRTSILIHQGKVTPGHRVGARHRDSPMPLGGGGYPDNCTFSEILKNEKKTADLILAELKEMGLRAELLSVAEKIGADNFLQVWQLLDSDCESLHRGELRVSFPRFTKYLRFQRDLFIKKRSEENKAADDIQKELAKNGFEISVRQVKRISKAEA